MRIHGLSRRLLACAVLLFSVQGVNAADAFVVTGIEMTGLQRISEGTVLNYLPIREGETATAENVRLAVRALFRAGFFTDIQVRRDGGALIFVFDERPTIAEFTIQGNRDIPTEQLEKILRSQGLAEGRVFNAATLEAMEAELEGVYQGRGKYNVKVDTEVEELPNNLVEVTLDVKEGAVSRIAGINIVGNEIFEQERLKDEMALKESHFWSWIASDDQYSREALVGDLEQLRSFYYDRGYADFEAETVQVSLSPDKRDVYLSIGIREGDVYTVADNQLRGELIVPADELEQFIVLKPGETFSMRMAEAGAELIVRRLELEGYAFAKVQPIPDVDRDNKTVSMTYHVDPGRRAYVRSIVFRGAPGTDDDVFRREMRVFEGAWLNNARVERSKVRLQRLPFVETVEVETAPVPGSPDEVDVIFDIKERNAGEFQVGVGYAGSATGIIGNVSVSHTNFLGTGDRINFGLATSSYRNSVSLTHRDPYATIDGISRSLSFFYQDANKLGRRLEQFDNTSYGIGLDYAYPISEYSSIGWGASASRNTLTGQRVEPGSGSMSQGSSLLVQEFLINPAHGDVTVTPFDARAQSIKLEYSELLLNGRFIYDTRNRAIFATRGMSSQLTVGVATLPGDIEYYVGQFEQRNFFPLGAGFTLTTNIDLAVAEPFGDTVELPPSKRFLAGGFDTIRGFRESYLGPYDDNVFDEDGNLVHQGTGYPVGGRLKTFFQTELLLPKFTGDDPTAPPENAQFSVFVDTGYVFPTVDDFDVEQFRVSAGVAATFLTPVGALRFGFGVPLVYEDGDELERIQFTIGSVF